MLATFSSQGLLRMGSNPASAQNVHAGSKIEGEHSMTDVKRGL